MPKCLYIYDSYLNIYMFFGYKNFIITLICGRHNKYAGVFNGFTNLN